MEAAGGLDWIAPSHVPPDLLIDGDPWRDLGDRPHARMGRLHKGPPIRFARRHPLASLAPNGVWLVVGAAESRAILLDSKSFISRGTTGVGQLIGEDLVLGPLESDRPDHARLRSLLQPFFQPAAIQKYATDLRDLTFALIRNLLPTPDFDFARDFAEKLPTHMFLKIMGLPQDHLPMFLEWEDAMMGRQSPEAMIEAFHALRDFLAQTIRERRASLSDDLLSAIVAATLDGGRIDDREALGMCMLLFVAGLDTVVSTLSWQFRHLAENPQHQDLLRQNPSLIPTAIEEFLRAYSITTITRIATRDVAIGGVTIRDGDIVTCPTMLGSRDPADHVDPDIADLDRGAKRHLAFGFGPHICLGMHLARMELRVSIERWLSLAPPFRLAEGHVPRCHGGISFGIDELQLTWAH